MVKKVKPSTDMVRKQLFIGLCLAILIGLMITGIYYGSRVTSLQVTGVKVIGGQTIPHAEVERITRDSFAGTYLRLIPKSFKPTFPKQTVKANVQAVDRINNVDVEVEKDTVIVVYDEHIPVGLWCETTSSKDCLFLDRAGYAFGAAPALEGSAFVRYIERGATPEKQATNFSTDFIKTNQAFITDLEDELGLYVTHIEKIGDYDLEYTVSGGGTIKASQGIELDKSFRNLRTILQSADFAHLAPGEFQYIDLRFGDKVFVNEDLGPADELATSSVEAAGE